MRAIILLALIGTALAVPKVSEMHSHRIVGGSPTTVDRYPYIVNLQYLAFGILWSQSCGGSLITVNTVLTAAHCVVGDRPSEWRARLGTSFRSSGGVVHDLSRIIVHEQYNRPTLSNDVAILHLARSANLGENIQLARIAGTNYNLPDSTSVETLGWGTLSSSGTTPEQLQVVSLYTISQQICAERYAYLKTLPGYQTWPDIDNTMLCAGVLDVGGRDACQGDSGGPLAHFGDIIIGIVSWGFGCADAFYPGVNSRVSYLSDWIVQHATA